MIAPLGETLPAGETAARVLYNALTGMTRLCESLVEEISFRRDGRVLTIAMRTDEIGANEENIQDVCTSLAQASAICAYSFDEETFWLEMTLPDVFQAGDVKLAHTEKTNQGEVRESTGLDEPSPEWFGDAIRALKEEQERLEFEDFSANTQQMAELADMYGVFKRVSADIAAEFSFSPPKLPLNEHGSCYLIAEKLTLGKADIDALFPCISHASSFGISYCSDNRIRLGAGSSYIYSNRE